MVRRAALAGGLTASAVALVPSAAVAAVTGHANQACYSHIPTRGSEPIVVTLSGGEPGAGFVLSATVPGKGEGSAGSASGTYDAAGNATAQITGVVTPSGTIDPVRGAPIALSVTSFTQGSGTFATPLGSVLVTNLAIKVALKPSNPRKKRRVAVSGTPFANQRLFGFVVKGKKGKHVLRRIALGRADGCGFASKRAVVAPKRFRTGNYTLYVNAGRKLEKAHALAYSFRIFRRVF
jgi:hypothetical protein